MQTLRFRFDWDILAYDVEYAREEEWTFSFFVSLPSIFSRTERETYCKSRRSMILT